MSYPCPCCDGTGCEECDRTGRRYRTTVDVGDGVTVSVSGTGSGESAVEIAEQLAELARVAFDRLDEGDAITATVNQRVNVRSITVDTASENLRPLPKNEDPDG